MNLKKGVNCSGVNPEILLALLVADGIYQDFGYDMTVTSLKDGKHMMKSLHYVGKAADIRISNVRKMDTIHIFKALIEALTDDFDVVLEPTHIHIEYDPKN